MADGLLSGGGRRAALDDIGAGLIRYIPPEWRALAGLIAEANPIRGIERAGQAARRLAAPEAAPMERVAATGNVLSEMAGVLAPAAVAGRAGMPAVQAVQEGLLGMSAPARAAGEAVIERLNQPGPMPTLYSNPIMRAPSGGVKTLKIRRSRDNIDDVIDASATIGLRGDVGFASVENLRGGVDLSDVEQKDRVNRLVSQISGPEGYFERIIIDGQGNVIEGQHRLEAARILGMGKIPVEQILAVEDHIDEPAAIAAIRSSFAGYLREDEARQVLRNVAEDVRAGFTEKYGANDVPREWLGPYNAALEYVKNISAFPIEKSKSSSFSFGPATGRALPTANNPAPNQSVPGILNMPSAVQAVQESLLGMRAPDAVSDRGDQILGLLRAGRGQEVTDEMLDMRDPVLNTRLNEYLYRNYDLPMDPDSRMARAWDTDAFHATRSAENFSQFRPGARGSIYMAATPEGAARGAAGQALEVAASNPISGTVAIMPLRINSGDVRGLTVNQSAYDALPDVLTESDVLAMAGRIKEAGLEYWDDAYEAVRFGDEYRYYKRDAPTARYQDLEPGRDAWGYRLGAFNAGSDLDSLARAAGMGKRGFMVADEGGSSIVASPDMPIRSRFARFDPRLAHLRNLSAGIGALGLLNMPSDEELRLRLSTYLNGG